MMAISSGRTRRNFPTRDATPATHKIPAVASGESTAARNIT
jgi:hypothetical protein